MVLTLPECNLQEVLYHTVLSLADELIVLALKAKALRYEIFLPHGRIERLEVVICASC